MLEKLKEFALSAKQVLLWIIAPIVAVVSVIVIAFLQKDKKITELKEKVANNEVGNTIKQEAEAKADADAKEKAYSDAAAEYERSSHGSGGDSAP